MIVKWRHCEGGSGAYLHSDQLCILSKSEKYAEMYEEPACF